MSWFQRLRPKIRALVATKEVPENLWVKCTQCGQMIFHREMAANVNTCTHCGHHMRMQPRDRLSSLFDDGAYGEIEPPKALVDPLRFRDRKRYTDRLKEAQSEAGRSPSSDAVIVAHGRIGDIPSVAACFDFGFMGGSMGVAVGEAIIAAAKLAILQEAALIVIASSGGARMQEGVLSLMQMPRTVIAIDELKEAGLPYIVILTNPTTGGVSASFAMLGDVQISEPGAMIGFAGRRVIEETIREKLPSDFQTAEYLYQRGMLDMVVPRKEMRDQLSRLLRHLMRPNPPAEIVPLPQERKAEQVAE